MSARCSRPETDGLQAQGLSLPGYGLDLEVRPCPLSVCDRGVLASLAAEGVTSFLGRMGTSRVVELRRH